MNGVVGCTTGSTSDQFSEGVNYTVMEVASDEFGIISGTWQAFVEFAAINGFQIAEGPLLPQVLSIAGTESPTVHSPGDLIPVTVSFSENVTLDQLGGAKLELDVDGMLVDALHTGDLAGTSLSFEAVAPMKTTMNAKVVANSLQLLGGATLIDSDLINADLDHGEIALSNDQISMERLSVYQAPPQPAPPAQGVEPSPHYSFRVREVGGTWLSPFAWFTKCLDQGTGVPDDNYYKDFIGGWSHTYCNFEMANNVPVEIEITRLVNDEQVDIQKATPHPRRKVRSWRIEDGKAYILIDRPTLFAVDIDGQMDENPTPSSEFINETALHGVSVFANPFILDKPDMSDPEVLAVDPGTVPNDDGWTTLYFKPGVHKLFDGAKWAQGDQFQLRSDKTYYIPGDAIVHGNFVNGEAPLNGQNIRIYGHGTLSGELIDHPKIFGITELEATKPFRPIRVGGDPKGCRVEGVTIADPAHHSCALEGGFNANPEDYNYIRWTKAISWRANGDGLSPNGSGYAEDCFLRTQDDGTYILGLGIRRMVYWADVNGMPLRCSQMTKFNSSFNKGPLYVEDIDVIYSRTAFAGNAGAAGRSTIGYPDPSGSFPGNTGAQVVFRNINVEDPFPTRLLFGWDLSAGTGLLGGSGERSGATFENVRAAARNVDAEQDILRGDSDALITNLTFDNVTLAGEHYDNINDFETNAFVSDLSFENTDPETMTYLNLSGYGKWYINDDWDTGVEPANNDIVEHTAVAEVLIVDAPVYAGTLNISHANTATLTVETGGHLTVTNAISVGASGVGTLNVIDGTLQIQSNLDSALIVMTGKLHIERGEILWAGDHINEIRDLYATNAITISNGQPSPALGLAQATLIGRQGRNRLYARYDNTSGYTSIFVSKLQQPHVWTQKL